MQANAIFHQPWLEYRHTLPDGRICLRVRAARGDVERAFALVGDAYGQGRLEDCCQALPMERAFRDEQFDYYQAVFAWQDRRINYVFRLENAAETMILDQDGLRAPEEMARLGGFTPFPYAYAYPAEPMPAWARGCVGYQIFPDRFRRAGRRAPGVEPWNSQRVQNEYRFGGNLRGMTQAAPYLKRLGVTVVYMCPLFLSDTSHRYNTFDYYQIDPLLGTLEDLRAFADALHARGMRLVMDGVFNHAGTRFAPFADALEKGESSEYYDWFFFDKRFPNGYDVFGTAAYMPKLNLKNPACAQYFLNVGRYWLREIGIDGWRLDVSPEVWPDFWRAFRKTVKAENPDALIVAECWNDAREWLTVGDMFDSNMHYPLSRALWRFFGEGVIDLPAFDAHVNRTLMMYPERNQQVLWNFLGSHDTQRFLHRAGEDQARLRAAVFFQMTHPGVPVIYYGDELGMTGGDDPYCRAPFRWDEVRGNALLAYYRRMTSLRNVSEALRLGDFKTWRVGEDGLYAYLRRSERQTALVVLNTGGQALETALALPEGFAGRAALRDAVSGRALPVREGAVALTLAPGEGAVFLKRARA